MVAAAHGSTPLSLSLSYQQLAPFQLDAVEGGDGGDGFVHGLKLDDAPALGAALMGGGGGVGFSRATLARISHATTHSLLFSYQTRRASRWRRRRCPPRGICP